MSGGPPAAWAAIILALSHAAVAAAHHRHAIEPRHCNSALCQRHTYPSNCFVPLALCHLGGHVRSDTNSLSLHSAILSPLLLGIGVPRPPSPYDICAPNFSNPPAFLMAQHNSPSVCWSGLSLRSHVIAATSQPCFDISFCRNIISPLGVNLGTGARKTSDDA